MTFNRPLGPFAIIYEARAKENIARPPGKRGPKPMRVNKSAHTPTTQADCDRNAVIAGRGVHLGKDL